MVVITTFSVGVFGALLTTSKIYQSSRELEAASQILQNEVESVRGLSWAEVVALPRVSVLGVGNAVDAQEVDAAGSASVDEEVVGSSFTLSRAVDSSVPEMRKLIYTVSWQNSAGQSKQLSSSGIYYTRSGVSDGHYRVYDQ